MQRWVGALLAVAIAGAVAWADGLYVPFSMPATICINQFVRSIAAATGTGTCASVAIGSDVSGLGTGNAAALAIATGSAGSFPTYTVSSWTPTLIGSATPGTGQTYAIQVGSYEQIGRQVTARFTVNSSSLGTAAGNIRVGGLPVAPSTTSSDSGHCFISIYIITGLAALNYGVTGATAGDGGTYLNLFQNGNAASTAITVAQAGASAYFQGVCFYRV